VPERVASAQPDPELRPSRSSGRHQVSGRDRVIGTHTRACAVRNCFQVGPVRQSAGSTPASCRICHTVEAAIGWPSLTSSPCTRRCPHIGLSVAMRITSLRIAAAVGGHPGRRRWVKSHLRATSRRCQASSVAGVTGNTSPHRCRGISRDSAASHSRSAAWYPTPADLAAQHRVLVPEHQEFGTFGRFTPGRHHQTAEQAAHEPVYDRQDHSEMISAREAARPGQIEYSSPTPSLLAACRHIRARRHHELA